MKKLYSLIILFFTSFSFLNAQCNYTINLVDSWGDGWNGNSIDVLVDNVVVLDGVTISSGANASYTFEVNTGEVITTTYNPTGSYQSENSYSIVDVVGTTVASPGRADITASDNLTATCPSCPPPTDLTASNITTGSADISWTGNSDATSYNIEYGLAGFTPGTAAGTTSTVSPATIADNPNSLFSTGTNPPWLYIHPITLTSDGVAVSSLEQTYTINVTSLPAGGVKWRLIKQNNGSGASFVPNGGGIDLVLGINTLIAPASTWNRYVKAQFKNNTFEFNEISINGDVVYSMFPVISGLDADTEYDVLVESNCGSDESDPASSSFTTLPDPTCDYTINMVDTYGDTWNGNAIEAFVNGISIGQFANNLSFGSGGVVQTATFSAYTGDEVSFSYIEGSYASEVQFEILDPEYTSLTGGFVSGASFADGDVILTDASSLSICVTPNCFSAADLTASNITAATVDLTWTAENSSSFNVEYGLAGFTPGTVAGTTLVVDVDETTIALQNPSLFETGGNATWAHIYPIVITSDLLESRPEQTFSINVTSLPAGGAKFRLIKQNVPPASGTTTASYVPGPAGINLVLGLNTLVANEVTWNRYVKAQFNSDEVGFNAMSVNGTPVYTNTGSVSLSGLDGNTEYDFHVQNDCDASGTGENVNSSFTTLPTCPQPSDLSASNITTETADISWTVGGAETAWNVEYGPVGFTLGTGTLVNTNPYTLSGLDPLTNYQVYVQADCGGGDVSEWAGPISVLTPGTCGFFTVELVDSYGDGWNGNELEVVVNGAVYTTLTIVSGTGPETTLIPVNIGDVVDFNYLPTGTYQSENSYKVFDQNQDEIYNEGATGIPASVTGVNACPSCLDPSALTASNVTSTTADISWTAGDTESAWNFEYGLSGFTQGSGTSFNLTTNSYSLTGLTPATSYDVHIQADCGSGNLSEWVGPISVSTPGTCGFFTV